MSATARIGLVVPRGNVVHEREIEQLRPRGVTFRTLPFDYPLGADDFCTSFTAALQPVLREFRHWGAEAVLVGCTTASMMCAPREFASELAEAAGAPVITAAAASKRAAEALGVCRLAVASPYGDPNNAILTAFLHSQGFEIVSMEALGLDVDLATWRAKAIPMPAEEVLALCLAADVDRAEAVYLPCTGVGSLGAIELFERRTGKLAFSSVQAGFWATLREVGIDGRRTGFGRLVQEWDPPQTALNRLAVGE
jgi:maleate cis-trans isomerase